MERKLASIQRITKLEPIEGADKIEKATVLGWSLVVKKGEFKENDLCVYCEIDSVLPDKPEFEFLKPRKFRIKTVRLRGQVSQGIAFPLSILPECRRDMCFEGEDVTELLGVTKYEPPIPAQLAGKVKGTFPSFIPKTDETRIQSVPDVLKRHNGKVFYFTEKLDGSSMTVYYNDPDKGLNGSFGVCSRNLELLEDENNTLWKVANKYNLKEKLSSIPLQSWSKHSNLAIQGELIGEGIQKNKYKLKGQDFYVFSIYDIDEAKFLSHEHAEYVCEHLGLKMVPTLGKIQLNNATVEDLVNLSKGNSQLNPDHMREGIVLRPVEEDFDGELGRLSFKVINPEFLLKYED